MPGKDFEQQVREQFSDWRLDPSEKAWGKLEAALLQKKLRRRFAYLTLSASLLMGALLWGNAYRQQQLSPPELAHARSKASVGQDTQASSSPATQAEPAPGGQVSASNPDGPTGGQVSASNTDGTPGGQIPTADTDGSPGAQGSTSAKPLAAIPQAPASVPRRGEDGQDSESVPAEGSVRPTAKPSMESLRSDKSSMKAKKTQRTKRQASVPVLARQEHVQQKKLSQQVEPLAGNNKTSSTDVIDAQQSAPPDQPASHNTDPSNTSVAVSPRLQTIDRQLLYPPLMVQQSVNGTPAPGLVVPATEALGPKPTAKRGLSIGVSLGMGRSAYGNGVSLSTQKLADQVANPGSSGSPATPVLYSYQQDAAFAGELGAWVHWPLSRKWSLRGGLSYQQWRTTTPVGVVSNTGRVFNNGIASVSTDLSYNSGRQDSYTNRFQLLSMPLELEWQLNAGKKLPVIWTLGVVPGVLMSSNVLLGVGDSVLYHHPDNQQRMQWGLRSGLMFRIMPNRQRPIDLGPVFQYQLNRLFVSPITEDGHLQYVGIEARMPILSLRRVQRSN